jgi:hypothetical protein
VADDEVLDLPAYPGLLVLRPGDNVLIALTEDPSEEQATEYAAILGDSFPGVEFTVVGGVESVVVLPPTPTTPKVRRAT